MAGPERKALLLVFSGNQGQGQESRIKCIEFWQDAYRYGKEKRMWRSHLRAYPSSWRQGHRRNPLSQLGRLGGEIVLSDRGYIRQLEDFILQVSRYLKNTKKGNKHYILDREVMSNILKTDNSEEIWCSVSRWTFWLINLRDFKCQLLRSILSAI